jgi:hypothetical protein
VSWAGVQAYTPVATPAPDSVPNSGEAHSASPDDGNGGRIAEITVVSPVDLPSSPNTVTSSTLHITLKRTGNDSADWERLSQLHQVLKTDQGADEFVVYLEDAERKRIQLSFPNERTHYTAGLRQLVESIVGSENLRII